MGVPNSFYKKGGQWPRGKVSKPLTEEEQAAAASIIGGERVLWLYDTLLKTGRRIATMDQPACYFISDDERTIMPVQLDVKMPDSETEENIREFVGKLLPHAKWKTVCAVCQEEIPVIAVVSFDSHARRKFSCECGCLLCHVSKVLRTARLLRLG